MIGFENADFGRITQMTGIENPDLEELLKIILALNMHILISPLHRCVLTVASFVWSAGIIDHRMQVSLLWILFVLSYGLQ